MKKSILSMELSEGDAVPRFYLPVYMCSDKRAYACYHVLIAWIILVCLIINNVFKSVWFDLYNFNKLQNANLKIKIDNIKEASFN